MGFRPVDTIPIRIDTAARAPALPPSRADAVRAALLRRAVPLARDVDGRPEPLATAALVADGDTLALLTAAHIFEHVAAGDLMLPLPCDGGWLALHRLRLRVLVRPELDIALLVIGAGALARRLRANWTPVPVAHLELGREAADSAGLYAVAGYPVSQTRRVEGQMFMKPVVLFTRALDGERLAYARTADRVDGVHIHTPELEGVSGALVWALHDHGDDDCWLRAAALQVAFRHSGHLRTAPLRAAPGLFARAAGR